MGDPKNNSDKHERQSYREITRRLFLQKLFSGAKLVAIAPWIPCYAAALGTDYSRLVELIKLKDRNKPLYVFNDYQETLDIDSHRANLEYLNSQPDLIRKIQVDLGGGEIRWRLTAFTQRLLFVPEKREEYATLFEAYCNDAIDYLLSKTKLNNPYRKMQTLLQSRPEISSTGITAFLVHNLVKEYVARYAFFNIKRKKITTELTGKIFTGVLGSYKTAIHLRDDGTFEFKRDRYTIWQNSASNPYTALTVPVEETLHIAVRPHSERVIKRDLESNGAKTIGKAEKKISKEWMAVEEALVGGVVHTLLPHFLEKYIYNLPPSAIARDLRSKGKFRKYRHLHKGLELVRTMGHRSAMAMYIDDPTEFKKLLM